MAARDDLRTKVEQAIGVHLSPNDRVILHSRLGWGGTPLTQQQVAKRIGYSQPRVSQLERELIARLDSVNARRSRNKKAQEQQVITLVEMYELLATQAEAVGTTVKSIARRAEQRSDGR
jgi:hypothetical protein